MCAAPPRLAPPVVPPLLHSFLGVSQVKQDHPSPLYCRLTDYMCVPMVLFYLFKSEHMPLLMMYLLQFEHMMIPVKCF